MVRKLFLILLTTFGMSTNLDFPNISNEIPGDVNQDGIVNILDIIITVNFIFEGEFIEIADLNEDSIVNVVDIIEIVQIIIYGWTPEFPQNILFIGNSYTYFNGGIHNHLSSMVIERFPDFHTNYNAITAGGATLQSHYSNTNTISTIEEGNWDYVILQEQSTRPVDNPQLFYDFAELMDEVITDSSAEAMFFMTWAREYNPDMIEDLANSYNTIGEQLEADVCPVGRAWELALELNPEIELYTNDQSHPNAKGTYLAVCMFYICLFGENPQGIEFTNDDSISNEERLFLQNVAWQLMNNY